MDNFKLPSRIYYYTSMAAILMMVGIGVVPVWVEGSWVRYFTPRGLASAAIVLIASRLGALVTRWLITKGREE